MMEMNQSSEALHAPPRFLLWLVLVIFFLLIVAIAAGVNYVLGGERLVSLIPFAGIAVAGVIVAALVGAVVYRRSLPRLTWLWVLLASILVVMALGVGGIIAYKNVLPPRYQEEMITSMPFMRALLPPTPQGGLLPTAPPHTDSISPQDLLNLPLPGTQPVAAATSPVIAVTEAPTSAPTATTAPTQADPPTASPTSVALLATHAPTNAPTATPTQAPTVSAATQVAAVDPLSDTSPKFDRPASTRMYGFTYVLQGWNDCGPANITMALSHFGWRQDQTYAANILKPNPEDKNVSPSEMVNFVRTQTQISAVTRMGGDMELVKDFIAANIPVIIETGYSLEGEDWLGHYQTVVGYDDTQNVFYVYDTWLGTGTGDAGLPIKYSDFDSRWQTFNRTFIALYTKDRENVVTQILGDRADVTKSDQIALQIATDEARANPQNAFAWFNMGTAYDKLGEYDKSAAAYDQAIHLNTLPFRMLWYQFGPFDAYFNTQRYDDVMALVANNINTAGNYVEETFYWQGKVYAAEGQKANAAVSFQKALAQNPNYQAARDALAALNS